MIYLQLFLEFFKVGLFCFGGAFGMIPLIEETVVTRGWLTESEFFNLIGVCESTPGPIAVNTATYVGSVMGGPLGSICATLGVVLPSFLIILLIAAVLKNLTDNKYFKGFMRGVKPVVVALILSTGSLLLLKTIGYAGVQKFRVDVVSVVILVLLVGIYFGITRLWKKKLSAVKIILLSAGLGFVVSMAFEAIKV
ncbi:MAG: chromate transporter [Lachnospiraceae bacterium]|nr:chromate transporter [Lachnospiraceae bacterium]MBQ8549036.1 chromate transporter [Lachnospiraceae bacterium]